MKATKLPISPDGKDAKERAAKAAENRRMAKDLAERYEETDRGGAVEGQLRAVLSDISDRLNARKLEFPTTRKWLNEFLDNRNFSKGTAAR